MVFKCFLFRTDADRSQRILSLQSHPVIKMVLNRTPEGCDLIG